MPVLLGKFKEKRLTDDILQGLEQLMGCIELGEIIESLGALKTEKAPHAKLGIAKFIENAIRTTYIDALEEVADRLGPLAVQISDEKDAALRDQGLVVLGVLLARVPTIAQRFIDPLIDAKKTKINAAKETVQLSKYDKSEKKAAAAAAAAKKKAAAEAKKKPAAPAKKSVAAAGAADEEMKDASAAGGDDALIDVAPSAPRRPPPNIGKKPVSKRAAAAAEEEDKLAEPEPPKKGPPARLAARAGAAAGGGTAKALKADDIQEEDIGAGMSKEQAIERVEAFYDAAHVAKFEEAKWQDKQAGFNGFKEQIEALKPDKVVVEATAKFVKAKMKDWKESNLNLMKEACFLLLCLSQHCDDIPKRALAVYAPFICDKIGDVKMSATIKEALLNASESATAKFVSVQVIKKALAAKAPNNVKESCNFLTQLVGDFGAGRVAIKETIDFAVHSANHQNKQVRDAAMALFAEIYKHLGEKTSQFLDAVKPATMALIQAEFDKVTPYGRGEFQSTRQVKGEAAQEESKGGGGGGGGGGAPDALAALESALPRADISKQLNAKLIKMFTEADWKLKVKGCEMVHGILREAQMRIQPDGIGELME